MNYVWLIVNFSISFAGFFECNHELLCVMRRLVDQLLLWGAASSSLSLSAIIIIIGVRSRWMSLKLLPASLLTLINSSKLTGMIFLWQRYTHCYFVSLWLRGCVAEHQQFFKVPKVRRRCSSDIIAHSMDKVSKCCASVRGQWTMPSSLLLRVY